MTTLLFAACGGGTNSTDNNTTLALSTGLVGQELTAPLHTGDTATDGLNWINYRRQQLGEQMLHRNSAIDLAAQGHFNYQKINNASTDSADGIHAAEELITAIYHRHAIFEPMFKEIGVGVSTVDGGNTYFTSDFGSNGLTTGLDNGNFVVWPYANQQNVPTIYLPKKKTLTQIQHEMRWAIQSVYMLTSMPP